MWIVASVLLGILLLYMFIYVLEVILLTYYNFKVKSGSKGIKKLKFQKFNNTWNKYVLPHTTEVK